MQCKWIHLLYFGSLQLIGNRFFLLPFFTNYIIFFFYRNYPKKNTHNAGFFNNFCAFGSGFAMYDTMNIHLHDKSKPNLKLTPVCELVNVVERFHRPSMEAVTIVTKLPTVSHSYQPNYPTG
jgi:hypothetical protein